MATLAALSARRAALLAAVCLLVAVGQCGCGGHKPTVTVTEHDIDPQAIENTIPGVRITFLYKVSDLGSGQHTLWANLYRMTTSVGPPVRVTVLVPPGHTGQTYEATVPVSAFIPLPPEGNNEDLAVEILLGEGETPTEYAVFAGLVRAERSGVTAGGLAGTADSYTTLPGPTATGTMHPLTAQRFRAEGVRIGGKPAASVQTVASDRLDFVAAVQIEVHPTNLTPTTAGEKTELYRFGLRVRRAADGQVIYPPADSAGQTIARRFVNGQSHRISVSLPTSALHLPGPTPCILELYAITDQSNHTYAPLLTMPITVQPPQ